MRKIVFVSEIKDPFADGSSTQIMTRNLLVGLKQNDYYVHFIALIDSNCNELSMSKYYLNIVDSISIIHSRMDLTLNRNKYKQLFIILRTIVTSVRYKRLIKNDLSSTLDILIDNDTLLISHAPSVESIFICNQLLKTYFFRDYIQYWSDPITIAGIYPEEIGFQRIPNYLLERYYLKNADRIVYGTKTLYDFQKRLFKRYASKLGYVDVSYCETNPNVIGTRQEKLLFGYAGSFYKYVRNILPLYNVFKHNTAANLLICGDGDIGITSTESVTVLNKRIPQNDICEYESRFDVVVCLLNSKCIQLPGKIFYQAQTDKIILIILDGKYVDELRSYLESFNRFEFCYNNEESIGEAINRICRGDCEVNLSCVDRLSPKYVAAKLVQSIDNRP